MKLNSKEENFDYPDEKNENPDGKMVSFSKKILGDRDGGERKR